jgi:hypothetical protein
MPLAEFIVARNPDAESSLPFLLFIPHLGGLWLKAKEMWPRSARVYCHPAEVPDPAALEILERVAVTQCERRGAAIDLVLARGINKRSQFVFTAARGRSMILWQTPKVATSARPGVRVPHARTAGFDAIVVDTREKYGYKFGAHKVGIVRRALPSGDYAALCGERIAAVVERKTIDDLIKCLVDGSLGFAMGELASHPIACVVVEGTYSGVLRHEYTRSGFLADVLARLAVRYPTVPIVFAESRKLAEEWTYRFLRAASAEANAPEIELVSASPPSAVAEPAVPVERKRGRPPRAEIKPLHAT